MKIEFTIPGVPIAKGRPKACIRGNHAGVYTPEKTLMAERSFLAQALPYKPVTPIKVAVGINVLFYMPIPKSWSNKKKAAAINGHHVCKPDIDNLLKTVLDAMNEVFFVDDSQIVKISCQKVYSGDPRTRVLLYWDEEAK